MSKYYLLRHANKLNNETTLQRPRDEFKMCQRTLPDEPSPLERRFANTVGKAETLTAARTKEGKDAP
jgi:hypothetical protein